MTMPRREPDRTTAPVIDGKTTEPRNFRCGPLPEEPVAVAVCQGATGLERWRPEAKRHAGQRELLWFESHKHVLVKHERKWIAIVGQDVRVARDSFADVRAFLDQEGIADALIVYVRENIGEQELFID